MIILIVDYNIKSISTSAVLFFENMLQSVSMDSNQRSVLLMRAVVPYDLYSQPLPYIYNTIVCILYSNVQMHSFIDSKPPCPYLL